MSTRVDSERLPTGAVTFMFTDVEGSTQVLHEVGEDRFRDLIEGHYEVIRSALSTHGGVEVATEGDSVFAVFVESLAALEAAMEIQKDLSRLGGDTSSPIRVRIGLHTGKGILGGDNYIGVDVHRASRISDSGHGGQVVVSESTAELLDGTPGVRFRTLGRYRLAGFPEPALIHQVTSSGLDEEFPPLRAPKAESHLPEALTDFVGREREIGVCAEILAEHRMLTLTGPGGTGKTRLALEIARSCETNFADGAYFVGLGPLSDPGLVPMAILDEIGLQTASGVDPLEHLSRHLAARSTLLVLDNFEQLVGGATVVSDLLAGASSLRVLVTSRSPLRLRGEREFPVPPLGIPRTADDLPGVAGSEAVRLFVGRAQAVRPDFSLDEENLETVCSIVTSLDGLPLAIELAASRLRSLTPELVLERLDNRLLASRSTDLPERQQTIVNTISWSYDLLDDDAKLLFEKLSVFSGTFGLAEAEKVCGAGHDLLDGLSDLVEHSLLRQTSTAGDPRFHMLTVIREFSYGALVSRGEDRPILDRHAAAYLEIAEAADREILTSRQLPWLGRLSIEHDNLRAAFDHAVSVGDATTALRLVGSLWRFWQIKGHIREGRQRAETALKMPDQGNPAARAHALAGLGGLLYWLGDWEATLEPYEESLRLLRTAGTEEELAEALYNASFPHAYAEDPELAASLLQESLAMNEKIGRDVGVGRAFWGLGNVHSYRKEWEQAVSYIEQAIDVFTDLDAPFDLGWAWFMLAHSLHNLERPETAVQPLSNALDIFADVNDVSAMALIFDLVGVLMLEAGSEDDAAYFVGGSQRLKTDTGIAIGDVELNRYPHLRDLFERLRDQPNVAFEEGNNAPLEEVIDRARQLLSQGYVSA